MEHAPGGNFSNSSNPAAVGRFRAPFQGSNAGQRLANAQNSRDPAADRKATRHKFKQAPVEKHEPPFPPQDEDKEGFHRKNQAEYDQHQRLSNLSSGSYYRSDAPQSSYPQQARYAPHDKTPRQESQRFNRHASAVRAPDASPVDDAARRPAWGSMYETNYSNDTAPIPTSPNEIDANPQDGHYPNNPNRGRDRDKGKRFNDPSELGEPPPRGRVHGSPNKKQIRANSYRPQPNRSAEAHEKPRRSLSEIRDPALGDRASSIGHSFRYKSPPPGSVDRPNKPHKPSQSPTEASDHPYHLGPQPVPFNRDEYSPQRLQPSQPQANDNNSARPRSRQKVHTSAPEKEPENALNPRPQTQKRGTFPNSKPHEPQGPAPTHPQGAPKSPPPYRVGENRPNVSPNPDSPTWSQPCRLKKKSTKEWPRSPEKDAHYPEQEFTQRDRGISFMRNGTDTKRQKHKSNASDYHNGGGMKRSRGHDRNGERGSASWKIRRQH